MVKARTWVLLATAVVGLFAASGCTPFSPGFYIFSMGPFTPIPVFPWVTERMEDKYCHTNDFKTVIMPPIRDGFPPPLCEDPPDTAMVLRAMPQRHPRYPLRLRGIPRRYPGRHRVDQGHR